MGRSHLSSRETRKMMCQPLIAVGVMLGLAAACQASYIPPGFRGTSNNFGSTSNNFRGTSNSFGGSSGGHAALGGFGGASSGFGGHSSSSGFRGTSGGFSSGHGGGQRQTIITVQKAPLVAASKDVVDTGVYSNLGGFRGNQAGFQGNQAGFNNNHAGFNNNQAGFNNNQAGFNSNQFGFNNNQAGFGNSFGTSNQFSGHQTGTTSQSYTSGNFIQPTQNFGSSSFHNTNRGY